MTNGPIDGVRQTYSRRRVLYLAGAGTATAALAACSSGSPEVVSETGTTPACVLTPEGIEGPFYADLNLVRSDITEDKPGAPLELRITVVDAETCAPIPDATVDIWHADAVGLYSAFVEQGDSENVDTTGHSFLRGVQSTDATGTATFTTIYPGWYRGRTTHVHVKIIFSDRTRVTTQLYFPDEITDGVYAGNQAYAERGAKDTTNDADGFDAELNSLRMTLAEAGVGHLATHSIGINRG